MNRERALSYKFAMLFSVLAVTSADRSWADERADLKLIARGVLDETKTSAERTKLIEAHPEVSAELIEALVADTAVGTKDEYRTIPWIWRVAIAAGKRNELKEMTRIFEVALPRDGGKLDDWRAVVIGGGMINGISLSGGWPAERLAEILKGQDALAKRWERTLKLAVKMADDTSVPTGTRYDALRFLGVEPWDHTGAQLFRYLAKGTHPELQQGAISGLSDVRSPGITVAQALISGLGHYSESNREMAINALMRDETRIQALLDAIGDGIVSLKSLGEKRVNLLLNSVDETIRERAKQLFKSKK